MAGSKPAPMILNAMGQMVEYTWHNLLNHNSGIELDEYVIMPNHYTRREESKKYGTIKFKAAGLSKVNMRPANPIEQGDRTFS